MKIESLEDLKSHRVSWRNAIVLAQVAARGEQSRFTAEEDIATGACDIDFKCSHDFALFLTPYPFSLRYDENYTFADIIGAGVG